MSKEINFKRLPESMQIWQAFKVDSINNF